MIRTRLDRADVSGADLRRTALHGCDLRHSVHLTQAQLDAAVGDPQTGVPPSLTRPKHWDDT